ncbi:TetR/AcrR family transcriptional regulator [Novosphingobium sp. TH158]|uniref:TetR/AcrR family transcriptional regulator n=1 Tax=Novosphingobium sp. TH158 TaxID=2067455 RepID=UPI000C7CCB25|nr:TetR/AcrR family transcriptional regulator [Novosphingobium sp. TH158]PLK26754.1 TetR/AcrR family transcriptional regulator [Novosphingobium sp. TH158]
MTTSRASQRMSRPDDARALRSREALRAALLALLEERPFHEITIRDITGRAGVSYPVFFRRYGSKEDLLEDIAADQVRRLLETTYPAMVPGQPEASLAQLCGYVEQHRALWKSLLTTAAAGAMRAEFARISQETGDTGPRMNSWLPVSLASRFVASGLFEILAWWLAQDEDYPVANVITLLRELIVQPMLVPRHVAMD